MILKEKDDVAPHLRELEALLVGPVTKEQREAVEEELWLIRAGAKGEKEAAYHLDFAWRNSRNVMVIHDLRLEHKGRVAQIDHLLLTRFLEFYVVESKGFGTEVKISEKGEWSARTRYGWKGIASPVQQNARHIEVLKSFIDDHGLAPKRLGFKLPIDFHNWVLVSPACQIQRSGDGWDQVVKMDLFYSEYLKRLDAAGVVEVASSAVRMVSRETVEALGRFLVAAHRPASFNYAARFAVLDKAIEPMATPAEEKVPRLSKDAPKCEACAAPLEQRVVRFCRLNSQRFSGKLLCKKCQPAAAGPVCDECGAELEAKVVAFCRFNSKKFGGRKLCRECQGSAIGTS